MAATVGIGLQNFEEIRKNDIFYIDKTRFIREWWESKDAVTLITRPRRFGKTLNMRMTEQFFSIDYAGRSDLFEGLSIWEHEEYRNLQGSYPVIFLSFANVKEASFQTAREKICYTIERLYNRSGFLLKSGLLNEKEKKFFQSVCADMKEYAATSSLGSLSEYLSRYYGKKVIILLDEYDTPMQEAYVNGYWDELLPFMRNLFNSTFKTNLYLERAIMTGITRVSKGSIFSDLNNMAVVTATSEKYMDSFGFTEKEVFAALDAFNLSDKKMRVREWYDGFTFGSMTDIYNPWSIINFLSSKKLDTYWADSSSNGLVSKLLQKGDKNIKQDFEKLMNGEEFKMEIDEQIVYDQLSIKKNAIWSLLLASGYLKIKNIEFVEDTGRYIYSLSLTNKEVRMMFEDMVHGWFDGCEDGGYNDFIEALLAGDIDLMNEFMNSISGSMFSSFDTGKKPSKAAPERFYHGFVLGLMVDLKGRYIVTSNRESGLGRYDIMMEPMDPGDDAIIIEFKVFKPKIEKTLSDSVERALMQIEERGYETDLIDRGIPKDRIRKYGFAFCGKKVLIGGAGQQQ